MKRFASEQVKTEAKKFVFGSRKAVYPAFIAAQANFEELSIAANSSRSNNSSHQDSISLSKDPRIAENPVLNNRRVQHGGSDCGTELPVTSTLDSPDRSEAGNIEYENGAKVSEQENCISNSIKVLDVQANDSVAIPLPDSSLSVSNQPEKLDDAEGNKAYRSSPEAFPRSHMTLLKSQGTPSSQVSVKAKKRLASSQKRKSLPSVQDSFSTPLHDIGDNRSSIEQLPKDKKRCNSFGSTRPENIDEEPRDGNNSNFIPQHFTADQIYCMEWSKNFIPQHFTFFLGGMRLV
ncbi:hypothetical protein PTKIN_Ptkin09bG0207100 [Pterospermum kingtungense]